MIAKEHIYNLRTNLQEVGSPLSEATDQHLMYMLDEARAVLASQKMDKIININQMTQWADFTIREATKAELGTMGSTQVKAVDIPVPISYSGGSGIFSVGPTDGKLNYAEISYSQLQTFTARKYTAASTKWLLMDSTIFLLNLKVSSTAKVRVRGIWDEPYKIIQARGEYKYLNPFYWEYPLTNKDARTVYQIAMSGDLGWKDIATRAVANRDREIQRAENEQNA